MHNETMLLAVLLGVGLASSTGLNTFLPMLITALAAHFHVFGIHLGSHFAWLESDTALIALAVASALETCADKIPAVDNALHLAATIMKPAAGALIAASVIPMSDPTSATLSGLIIGAPTAFGFQTAKTATRGIATAATFGLANPLISIVEDIMSFALTLLSLIAPILVPLVMIAAIFAMRKLWSAFLARRAKASA